MERDSNRGLWQKEALMNIGAKAATTKYIIFLDSDVHSNKTDWLSRIRGKLEEDERVMVQGFTICRDSKFPERHSFVSRAGKLVFDIRSDLMHNPGLVWGISKSLLELNDYLNPYMIYGGGDSMFVEEYLNGNNILGRCWITQFPKVKHLKRNVKQNGIIDCVDDNLVHCNHGLIGKRNYCTRHHMTTFFSKEMNELVKLDSRGLLKWVNSECPERLMCGKRYDMDNIDTTRRICKDILDIVEDQRNANLSR